MPLLHNTVAKFIHNFAAPRAKALQQEVWPVGNGNPSYVGSRAVDLLCLSISDDDVRVSSQIKCRM